MTKTELQNKPCPICRGWARVFKLPDDQFCQSPERIAALDDMNLMIAELMEMTPEGKSREDWNAAHGFLPEPALAINSRTLNDYAAEVHAANGKWWVDLETGLPVKRNVGELLMLCTSELAEAMEGHRKNLPDDHLPARSMFEVELADCVIRILDICAGMGLDLEGAYRDKMLYNASRIDHTLAARKAAGGKKY